MLFFVNRTRRNPFLRWGAKSTVGVSDGQTGHLLPDGGLRVVEVDRTFAAATAHGHNAERTLIPGRLNILHRFGRKHHLISADGAEHGRNPPNETAVLGQQEDTCEQQSCTNQQHFQIHSAVQPVVAESERGFMQEKDAVARLKEGITAEQQGDQRKHAIDARLIAALFQILGQLLNHADRPVTPDCPA